MSINVIFRADASKNIGTGHISRCLTLAEALDKEGANISFICRELPGNINNFIKKKGFKVHKLPYNAKSIKADVKSYESEWLDLNWRDDAKETLEILEKNHNVDWLIIDHYSINRLWEEQMRLFVKKIMVIDDLANRNHDCDILLDQNYIENGNRYKKLVPENCVQLLGPKYVLLRQQFYFAKKKLKNKNGAVKKILIFLGGADPDNETSKVLDAIKLLKMPDIYVDVLIGQVNPFLNEIKKLAGEIPNTKCHINVENMAELLIDAELCVGAGGSTTWERCCLGLPSIVMIIAENQIKVAESLAKKGIIINLGWHKKVTKNDIKNALLNLINDQDKLRTMSLKGMEMVDNYGTKRVVEKIFYLQ